MATDPSDSMLQDPKDDINAQIEALNSQEIKDDISFDISDVHPAI